MDVAVFMFKQGQDVKVKVVNDKLYEVNALLKVCIIDF
jgi:hypothetical protein